MSKKLYAVNVRTVYIDQYEILAETEEEAIALVASGKGRTNQWLSEEGYRLPTDTWTAIRSPHEWKPENGGHYPKGAAQQWRGKA